MRGLRIITIYALCLSAMLPSVAQGDASYLGYTGLIFTPTAGALSIGRFSATGAFVSGDNNNDTTFIGGSIGLARTLEAGAAWLDSDPGDGEVIINGKWQFLGQSLTRPALAVGFADITDEIDATPYFVASKSLTFPGTSFRGPQVSVGIGSGMLDGLFAGLSAFVGDRVELMIEYDTDDVNIGARFGVAEMLKLNAALLAGDDFAVGLNFNAGF